MNLLPKTYKEFSQKDYWNKFFKKRGKEAFEWYGEYLELCVQLHKYIKHKDSILVPGCGNSRLSADMYDVGYLNITNIDLSEVVVKQMKSINAQRPTMKFLCMDATNMTFPDDEFSVVLDKGTLDALMSDESVETVERIDKYFAEIKRVLKFGGRYICISLLENYIVNKLFKTFCDKSWLIRVIRCHEAEAKNAENSDGMTLPVFAVVITKFKVMPEIILETCMVGEKIIRVPTIESLLEHVKTAQDTAFITKGLSKTNLDEDDEVKIDLMEPTDESPRYSLHILDHKFSEPVNKYAVFIVPQGRESEWMFGTKAGRRQLQDSAKFSRLVVATLSRDHQYSSLDGVKEELEHTAKMLIPNGFSGQIPFLSLGNELGRRTRVADGASRRSGRYVVEDVDVDGAARRRLVFLDNQLLVQSEAALKTVTRKNKTKQVVDFGHISQYHAFMVVGVQLCRRRGARAAVLGLGGGGLCMFLRKCFDSLSVTAVDIDPDMLLVARNHFNLQLDEFLDVQIKDGEDFLKDEVASGNKYEAVMFDMDSKDQSVGLSCPPRQFVTDHSLENVKTILSEDGHFILNLVCRDKQIYASIIDTLKQHFRRIISVKLYEEVNEVIFASNCDAEYTADNLEAAIKSLNCRARQRNLVTVKCVDLKDFLQSITHIS